MLRQLALCGMVASVIWTGRVCGQEAPNPEEIRAFTARLAQGDAPAEEEMTEMRKLFARVLIRPEHLDVGQNARYEIAEILLRRGDPRGAVAKLRELLAGQPKAGEAVWVTRFNIAELLRVTLDENEQAVAEFEQVKGNLEAIAQREMLDLIERDPKKGAPALEKRAAEAKEKGERLALLTRLGNLYRRQKQDEKAMEVFQRIAQEATPEAVEAMRQEAASRVEATFRQVGQLRQEQKWEEAERLQQSVHRRIQALRTLGRHDEALAMVRAAERIEAEANR